MPATLPVSSCVCSGPSTVMLGSYVPTERGIRQGEESSIRMGWKRMATVRAMAMAGTSTSTWKRARHSRPDWKASFVIPSLRGRGLCTSKRTPSMSVSTKAKGSTKMASCTTLLLLLHKTHTLIRRPVEPISMPFHVPNTSTDATITVKEIAPPPVRYTLARSRPPPAEGMVYIPRLLEGLE